MEKTIKTGKTKPAAPEKHTEPKQNSQEVYEALRKSEERYRELVEHANSIILRWDKNGEVTFFNEYAQKFFGFTEQEIIGKHVIGTIVPESESTGRDLRPLMQHICNHPEEHRYNINENMTKDGTRVWVAWTNKILTDDTGEAIGGGTDSFNPNISSSVSVTIVNDTPTLMGIASMDRTYTEGPGMTVAAPTAGTSVFL